MKAVYKRMLSIATSLLLEEERQGSDSKRNAQLSQGQALLSLYDNVRSNHVINLSSSCSVFGRGPSERIQLHDCRRVASRRVQRLNFLIGMRSPRTLLAPERSYRRGIKHGNSIWRPHKGMIHRRAA